MHGSVRGLFSILGATAMLALVAFVWLAWRLSEGPVALPFLTQPLEQALTVPHGPTIAIGGTELIWDRAATTLELRAEAVTLTASGTEMAEIPELAVTFSPLALVRGTIAITAFRLLGPKLRLQRAVDGSLSLGMGEASAQGATGIMEAALAALQVSPGGESLLGQLRRFQVSHADLTVDDRRLGTTWHAPDATLTFARQAGGIVADASATLDLGGPPATFTAHADYASASRSASGWVEWRALRLDRLAAAGARLAPLAALAFPSNGRIDAQGSLDDGISSVAIKLDGGAGQLDARQWLDKTWDIAGLSLVARLGPGLDKLDVDELRIDLGGAVVSLTGGASGLAGSPQFEGIATIPDLAFDRVADLWPESVLTDPRKWIVEHLSKGTAHAVRINLAGHVATDAAGNRQFVADKLEGEMQADGVQVDYLPPMPPIRRAAGTATLGADGLTVKVTGGDIGGLAITGASVRLPDLGLNGSAQVEATAQGSAADLLRLIDSKPLNFAKAMNIDPARITGNTQVDFSIGVPFIDVRLDKLAPHVEARTTGLALPGVFAGLDLSEGDFVIDADNAGMEAKGDGRLDGTAATIDWQESFTKSAPLRSRYTVNATLDDGARQNLGLTGPPFDAPWLTGPVPVRVDASVARDGAGMLTIDGDLAQASMSLPNFGWDKGPGPAGKLQATIDLDGGAMTAARFALAAGGLDVAGSVAFDQGRPQSIVLDRLDFGRTALAGRITLNGAGNGLAFDVAGAALDASAFLGPSPTPASETGTASAPAPAAAGPPIEVTAKLDKLWLSANQSLTDVTARVSRLGTIWREAAIDGTLAGGAPVHIQLTPEDATARHLVVTSTDAGGFLSTFRLLSNVVGGTLRIDGSFDDTKPNHPLAGHLTVSNYRVVRAPLLARLLTVAAFTGVLDVMTGDGIIFISMDVPFTLAEGVLTLKDAQAAGPSLGITGNGQIDLDHDRIAVEGTVVPAYLVQGIVSGIPLIGPAISGGKGAGLFAVTYAMKGATSDPEVTVNPLTALTPGFLRGLFSFFQGDGGTRVPNQDAPGEPPGTTSPKPPP